MAVGFKLPMRTRAGSDGRHQGVRLPYVHRMVPRNGVTWCAKYLGRKGSDADWITTLSLLKRTIIIENECVTYVTRIRISIGFT
jgi:hypothetical protein